MQSSVAGYAALSAAIPDLAFAYRLKAPEILVISLLAEGNRLAAFVAPIPLISLSFSPWSQLLVGLPVQN